MLLCDAIKQFKKYTAVTKTKGTQDYYKYLLNMLDTHMGQIQCDQITNDIILNYIITLK